MKVVFGLSVVNALATANEEAKEIKTNTERFGRLPILFSSIVVMPLKLLMRKLEPALELSTLLWSLSVFLVQLQFL
jgi:hypothetical protein